MHSHGSFLLLCVCCCGYAAVRQRRRPEIEPRCPNVGTRRLWGALEHLAAHLVANRALAAGERGALAGQGAAAEPWEAHRRRYVARTAHSCAALVVPRHIPQASDAASAS